jgi:hypothetical protein
MLNRLVRSFVPALVLATLPVASFAGIAVGVSIDIAPPPLPVYVQPVAPGPDFIWTPGYWAWGDEGYYWVPGTWVVAPSPGLLWTPGYWGWGGSAYMWHAGYWGPHVGFYGGVNYGFGYTGVGFEGCYWRGGHVVYNRAVTNVTRINVTNIYNRTVEVRNYSHVSFNGGHGGIAARASAAQLAAEREHHFSPTSVQRQHFDMAARDRDLRASVNNGRPHIAATERAASFSGRGVVGARAAGGNYHPAAFRNDRPTSAQREAVHGSAAVHSEPGHNNFAHDQAQRTDRPPSAQHAAPPRPEMHGASARPDMHTMPARPDTHAQSAPRPDMRAPVAPRPEMHAAAPRPAMHAAPPRPEVHSAPPRPEMRAATPRPEVRGGGSSEPRVARAERPQGPPGGGGQSRGSQSPHQNQSGGREAAHDRR